MRDVDQLQGFYESDLKDQLAALETQRQVIVRRILITAGVTAAVSAIFLAVILASNWKPQLVVAPIVIGLVAGGLWTNSVYHEFRTQFKARIIQPIVSFLDPELRYVASGSIPAGTFRKAGIFEHSIDRYRGDDLVRGRIGDTGMEFSEVHAEYKTETRDSKGHKRTHWHTIFKGLFFSADFNKDFHGRTFVLTDVAEKSMGWLGQKLQEWNFSRDELVKTEDAEFEREFVVYSNDQVEARYILSPALMRRLLGFRTGTKKQVQFSFVETRVFVAIPYAEDLFEPRLFRTVVDFEPIRTYFEILNLAVGLVEDLNLNTRVWTKV